MQLTPNYNLKKPEGTDPVDIQDFNDNADILDAELNKKADSAGGDISNMTIKALEEPAGTQFPVPEAGETSKSFLGKIRKFMNDFKSWNTGVCMIGQIVNNCVTNNDKLPLSAAQGKVLMDLYSVLNTKIDLKIPSETLSYTNLSATNAVKAWFASASMPNGVCLRLINHSTGIILAIAYKVSDYYGAIVYFGYGIDGIQLIRHINGAWS